MSPPKRKPIGQLLLEKGIINENQLKAGLERQERWGKRLGENLVDLGYLSDKHLAKVLSDIFHVPAIDVDTAPINKLATHLIPADVCVKHRLMPLSLKRIDGKEQLVVAFSDPSNLEALDILRNYAQRPVFQVVGTFSSIDRAIRAFYTHATEYRGSEDRREVTVSGENGGPMEVVHSIAVEEDHMSQYTQASNALIGDPSLHRALAMLIESLKQKGIFTGEEAKKLLSLLNP